MCFEIQFFSLSSKIWGIFFHLIHSQCYLIASESINEIKRNRSWTQFLKCLLIRIEDKVNS